jgi:hypothetical protein
VSRTQSLDTRFRLPPNKICQVVIEHSYGKTFLAIDSSAIEEVAPILDFELISEKRCLLVVIPIILRYRQDFSITCYVMLENLLWSLYFIK